MIVAAARTGLRQGELFALRDRDVNLEKAELRVEHTADQRRLQRPKTKARRCTVGLSQRAVVVLRQQMLARPPNDRGLVFPSPRGKVLEKGNFTGRVFRPAVDSAVADEEHPRPELEGVRFHDLRHTYASLMIAAGAHVKLVQEQLGHASAVIALDVYGHPFPGSCTEVGKHLDRLLASGSQGAAK